MDRGFGSAYRGAPNFGANNLSGFRERDDRRYDDFYSDNRRGGVGGNTNRRGGDWGGANRDRGFFNQGSQPVAGRDRALGGNVNGQMLAALQQQQSLLTAFMNSQSSGLLPSPNNSFGQGGGKFGGRYGGPNRAGDKRKQDAGNPSGFHKRGRTNSGSYGKKGKQSGTPYRPAKNEAAKAKPAATAKVVEEPDIPDGEVEVPDSLMDSVEKLRQREDIERNVADEDVQKLLVFCFNGKGYQCLTCGLFLMKEPAFLHHLMGKSHVMNVIDSRSAKKYQEIRDILDIDLVPDDWYEQNEKARAIILKQAKLHMKAQREIKQRDIENYNKNPVNFFTVNMETYKSAVKNGDTVCITSLVQSTVEVKEFTKDKFFGCEFVKAVSGFHCRLCDVHVKDAAQVVPHINNRQHKNNYQAHLRKNPAYEKVQMEQNKDLSDVLAEHEESNVLLSETPKAKEATFLSILEPHIVRVPKLLLPPTPKPEKVDSEKKEESNEKDKSAEQDDAKEDATEDVEEGHANGDADEKEENIEEEHEDDEQEEEVKQEAGDELYDPTEGTEEKADDDAENNVEEKDVALEEPIKEEPKPKKSILKKTTTTPKTRGGAVRGGRGRGRKIVTPSPKARSRKAKEEVAEPVIDQDDSNDGNFMDGFQVVDEVEED